MKKYGCLVCGYIYNPDEELDESGDKVSFDELPDDWICPDCGADKEQFEAI